MGDTGLFITFEGIEGCGKTTQMELLREYLEAKGRRVVKVREPGGTPLGEKVRSILLNIEDKVDPWAELFLFEACRAQIVKDVIRPALNDGDTVICDRFTDSTVAYQGYGRGLDLESVARINGLAAGGIVPDMTFLIDCEPETGLDRAWKRINLLVETSTQGEARFEKETLEFHRKVRLGYLREAKKNPGRIKVVDGNAEIPLIHRKICGIMDGIL